MSYSLQPDYEKIKNRYEAFWKQEIIDRPLVSLTVPAEKQIPVPRKEYADIACRWKDIEFRADEIAARLSNVEYLADALPIAKTNMGPEIFSAWCGCSYIFGERTCWSEPCVFDWERDVDQAVFSPEHPLFKLTVRFTELLIDRGRGQFIVGLTDFHPGGDHLAALRDPAQLALDMLEHVDHVKAKLLDSYMEFFPVYTGFYNLIRDAGMPATTWLPLIHDGTFYVPSNDFSALISNDMFVDVFLPGMIEECRFYDRSIYHLDGPGALQHLPTLLEIPELDAVQWVPGAGNEDFVRWIPVYRQIQKAGKSLHISELTIDDLPTLFENLKPEGICICGIRGAENRETALRVLKRIEKWQ